MSEWYWRVIALKTAFIITCLASYVRGEETIHKLPFCNPDITSANGGSTSNDLVIVSTLDGKITAFTTENGIKAWDLQTQPLLSSNLHHVELTSGGKWVRLVPSLRGTLYSVSGDTIEPLPFDSEQLLSSSFKYSEDLVIAGAREARWTGVEASGGSVVYECGSRGCSGEKEAVATGQELLVLRRNSNTVRALDPRTGTEKWNFSVSEHHLAVSGVDCANRAPTGPLAADYNIAVAVPEGIVGVRSIDDPPVMVWQHKLEAPVASVWRLRAGTLQNIDVLWAATKFLTADSYVQTTPPSLYIGLHDHQLYVQEGQLYAQKMAKAVTTKQVPWKLKQSRPLLAGPEMALANLQDSDPNTLALITLYGSTGPNNNHGYFLYNEDTCDHTIQITGGNPDIVPPDEMDDQSEHHHVHVHVYSLWFWWKEVLLIAISSALLMNLMIWPRFFAPRFRPPTPLPINQEYIVVERHYDRTPSNGSQNYVGRYETDFTPVACLGRGGFGVVFEAKNNIDHCSYAVKRITLPRRESKRERVLREVRALAKLEHENIVRYFNAWLEEPPPMWQEQRDALWIRELDGVALQMSEDYTTPKNNVETPSPFTSLSKSHSGPRNVVLNIQKNPFENSINAVLNGIDCCKKEEGTKRNRSLSCNDSLSITFEEPIKASKEILENSLDMTIDKNLPKNFSLAKNLASGDNDDSFIVFAQPEDLNHNSKGLSLAMGGADISKQGDDKIINGHTVVSSHTRSAKKKKKGHTRHWSLDMCVKSSQDIAPNGGTKMYLYIQMQLCRRDSLHDWLRNNRTFEERAGLANSLFSQIVSAVEYVHLAGLIHRDLKPSNIFFAPDGRVKVGDFGLVTAMGDSTPEASPEAIDIQARHTYRVGTHLYMSPEQMKGRAYNYKVDIYSLGLILFELLYPFGTESERIDCLLQLRRGSYPKIFRMKHPNEMEVLKLMLSEEPTERPTAFGGLVSLVTGGASGLGKATVERLAKNGGKVVLLDIQETRAQELIKTLGDNVILSPGNVTHEEDVKKCLELTKEKFGRLDCVINCAGTSRAYQTFNFHNKKSHRLEDFADIINVNTIGTFNVIRLSVALIAENPPNGDGQKGVIVNTASTIAYEGDIGQAAYAASTAGIIGMTLPIARDLSSQGIRVVTIAPGYFETPLISYLPEKVKEYLMRMTPFPSRFGKPEEFAHLVTSIIENPMLNGEVIRLDGAHRCFPL